MFVCRYYRIYDIGREIDLAALEKALAGDPAAEYSLGRAGFQRVKPKSIMLEAQPLMLKMKPFRIERVGQQLDFSVIAKIYDIGAMSLCFVVEDPGSPVPRLEEVAISLYGQEGLVEYFSEYFTRLADLLRPHLRDMTLTPGFYEDYVIYVMDRIERSVDPAVLLSGERDGAISPQMRDEITRNSLSYRNDDLVILSWDAALVCEPGNPADIIDLIEFANVQVLELRYYDRELARQMAKMYDDIEFADKMPGYRRSGRYHAIMSELMMTSAEISEITEKVNNLIKVTEDVYYARVYATVLKVIRSGQWSESVNRKIEVIRQNYSMLSDEVRIQHSNFLEWVIIVLITLEFALAIWQSIR
ncbi:MAG TPA: hypothetical protein VMS89_06505 [Methanoregulaceae archaeon]|nr:hypothetical protein [Methanoregulaceae archaeon]